MMNEAEIPETFVAARPEEFEVILPRSTIERALKQLADATCAPSFQDAMELVWFKFDPNSNRTMRECVSMLLTLYRHALDGNVKPHLDLEEFYERMYIGMTTGCDDTPVYPTP
jgi:hypothetical protein